MTRQTREMQQNLCFFSLRSLSLREKTCVNEFLELNQNSLLSL
jgi:hypothetical protein